MNLKYVCQRDFANGSVYMLETKDKYPIEVTDTFLPFYTKNAIGPTQNSLISDNLGDRTERWMIGVSCMSGCPVKCKFCATGTLSKWRSLTAEEITDQVKFVIDRNPMYSFIDAKEHKINYTRMGEPFLNIKEVKKAIEEIDKSYPSTHHYISTIGLKNSDFSWIKDNITLQVSLHSLDEKRRDELIPIRRKMSISELGKIRTKSALKTTLNLSLIDQKDFNMDKICENFDKNNFFIKLSPINPNPISLKNSIGEGIIETKNLL